jgi:hypothetical protein
MEKFDGGYYRKGCNADRSTHVSQIDLSGYLHASTRGSWQQTVDLCTPSIISLWFSQCITFLWRGLERQGRMRVACMAANLTRSSGADHALLYGIHLIRDKKAA